MKKILTLAILFLGLSLATNAQESYRHALNLGIGIGGYGGHYQNTNHSIPVLSANYELGVAKNFTLAPFIAFYTFTDEYYWGNPQHPDKYYRYSETVIPIGLKGTYYFDDLLKANSRWDFYLAGSLGFAFVSSTWDSGYNGDENHFHNGNPVFLDLHIGSEYHCSKRLGIFLDLSTRASTIGLAIHRK
jgi:hypothetical protein